MRRESQAISAAAATGKDALGAQQRIKLGMSNRRLRSERGCVVAGAWEMDWISKVEVNFCHRNTFDT